MPLIETKGAASAQGFGEFAKVGAANYIEDVFSTYLYTGNGSTQTITNGIDLSTKGGLVWIKSRSAATNNFLFDTERGTTDELNSNTTDAEASLANSLTAFNTDGFSIGSATGIGVNAATYVSWAFRKQPKFFDVVTYTGNGSSLNRAIAHNLGSVPGCIIVKSTSNSSTWVVWHRGNTSYGTSPWYNLSLNTTDAGNNALGIDTTPTSSVFYVRADPPFNSYQTNINGQTYVAYLFAHDAGGFGLTGTDNVISCGSLSGAGTTVNLGWEPQWILAKRTDTTGNWYIDDNMRGWPAAPGNDNPLLANTSGAEPTGYAGFANITSTGFTNNFNGDYIYIAIRRGPMKTPTSGTSVFTPVAQNVGPNTSTNVGFAADTVIARLNRTIAQSTTVADRLRGYATTATSGGAGLNTNDTQAEYVGNTSYYNVNNTSALVGNSTANVDAASWFFQRAPGFFDVVCYTGTGSARTVNHNLGVAPELLIVKMRSGTNPWPVYASAQGATKYTTLNSDSAFSTAGSSTWNNTSPTASVFSVGNSAEVNGSGSTYVAYLFATVSGVSKVGSYTGTGTTKQIDCGFTGGARFVLIKRTDSTGDWYVWDSARGIVSGNDPYLLLNSTAAEVTNTDWVDTHSPGFELSNAAGNNVNINGGSFIFLAIA